MGTSSLREDTVGWIARTVLVALLGFAASTKGLAWHLDLGNTVAPDQPETAITLLVALGPWVGLLEAVLAVLLAFAVRTRTVLRVTVLLAVSWAVVTLVFAMRGVDVTDCGCLGPRIRLDVTDHVLISVGALCLCLGQGSVLLARPPPVTSS